MVSSDIRLVYYLMLKGDEWVCFECKDTLATDFLWSSNEYTEVSVCIDIINNKIPKTKWKNIKICEKEKNENKKRVC